MSEVRKRRSESYIFLTSVVSGATSGCMGVMAGYPLETVRVRLQTQREHVDFKGVVDCLVKTVRGEGVRGLFKGMSSPLVGATLTKTVNFGTYGVFVARLQQGRPHSKAAVMAAGLASSLLATVVLCPVDRAKILLQTQRTELEKARAEGRALTAATLSDERRYTGPASVWRHQGVRGMYRGWSVTAVREAVYGSVYFALFETLKHILSSALWGSQHPQGFAQGLHFASLLFCGATTGAVVWTLMFPIDVVKSKIQANPSRTGPSAFSVAKAHFAAEGWKGFYKGWTAAIYRAFPAHAVVLATYSTLITYFEKIE